MAKVRPHLSILFFLLLGNSVFAQQRYLLHIRPVDKDSAFITDVLGLQKDFYNREACAGYINNLPAYLQTKGYVTASLDTVQYDSSAARIVLYLGEAYRWTRLDASQVDPELLEAVGWRERAFSNKSIDFALVASLQQKMLGYLENNGHPFARIYLDSLQLEGEEVSAKLKVNKGPAYAIDSIRIFGNAKISNDYLQRYLDIKNGSSYSKEKLQRISSRIRELTYIEEEYPPKLVWLTSGAVIEVYLKQKRSSQVSLIVGFLPNNDQLSSKKMLITGEGNLNLKNALGAGETIGLVWQQLQVKSQRLNISYLHPYLFRSPFGLDFAFDMFRKDSTFLNINMQIGAQYILNTQQSGKLFLQRFSSILNANTNDLDYIIQNKRLPDAIDVSATNLGLEYEVNSTNYRFNPVRGNELKLVTTIGNKKVKKNNAIVELKDPGNPAFDFESLYDTVKLKTYQFRVKGTAAKYFPMSKKGTSTIKLAANGGFLQSGNIYRNELFQIGGYKLLRGFDEESQYLSQYAIGTLEYRVLAGENSYFAAFTDGGWGRVASQNQKANHTYISAGLGMAFEFPKVGIFNLAWAVGKRNDTDFNLRQSKIHFGFVSYF